MASSISTGVPAAALARLAVRITCWYLSFDQLRVRKTHKQLTQQNLTKPVRKPKKSSTPHLYYFETKKDA
jgi:hypothetical protein